MMRTLVLTLLLVACSSQTPAPDAAAPTAPDVAPPPAPPPARPEIPAKPCEPLAAADDAKLVRLEELALDCKDGLVAATIDAMAIERSIVQGRAELSQIEQARAACATFLGELEGEALTVPGCRRSEQAGMRANPVASALLVAGAQAWVHIEAHRYDDAAKLLGRAIRTSVMVGRSDDLADILVLSGIGKQLERLEPLSTKVVPATREVVRADLTAAVAHLLEPDARSRLLLEHGVRIGKTKLDDPSAPFYGAAAAEVLAEFQPESDWQGLAEQARKTLQEAPRPSDQGSIETLTPTQRAYLARQSKVSVLDLLDNVARNLTPLEAKLRKTQAAW